MHVSSESRVVDPTDEITCEAKLLPMEQGKCGLNMAVCAFGGRERVVLHLSRVHPQTDRVQSPATRTHAAQVYKFYN